MNQTCDRRPGHRARDAATLTADGRARPLTPSDHRCQTYTRGQSHEQPCRRTIGPGQVISLARRGQRNPPAENGAAGHTASAQTVRSQVTPGDTARRPGHPPLRRPSRGRSCNPPRRARRLTAARLVPVL